MSITDPAGRLQTQREMRNQIGYLRLVLGTTGSAEIVSQARSRFP
jgi:hypothetical protein